MATRQRRCAAPTNERRTGVAIKLAAPWQAPGSRLQDRAAGQLDTNPGPPILAEVTVIDRQDSRGGGGRGRQISFE